VKKLVRDNGFAKIEVGTVEAFQGKEKRVIIISTVRANCGLLDHDAKFQLGFLVDDKVHDLLIVMSPYT
jgi:helicase MOV-10